MISALLHLLAGQGFLLFSVVYIISCVIAVPYKKFHRIGIHQPILKFLSHRMNFKGDGMFLGIGSDCINGFIAMFFPAIGHQPYRFTAWHTGISDGIIRVCFKMDFIHAGPHQHCHRIGIVFMIIGKCCIRLQLLPVFQC